VQPRTTFRVVAVMAVLTVLTALLAAPSSAAPAAEGASGRYLVRARSAADLGALRAKAVADGAKVVQTIPQINAMVVRASRPPRPGWPPTAGPRALPPTA
jgi:hypothetical protein